MWVYHSWTLMETLALTWFLIRHWSQSLTDGPLKGIFVHHYNSAIEAFILHTHMYLDTTCPRHKKSLLNTLNTCSTKRPYKLDRRTIWRSWKLAMIRSKALEVRERFTVLAVSSGYSPHSRLPYFGVPWLVRLADGFCVIEVSIK